ncbi:hypothetical protein [Paracoccus sp. TOH]|uniref:hypothetical protein n=1 Tax=Paracoccus sp. TOH TaxID=1263728 RepID=UPI0025AF929D|nr:hypothetical protein [Paracoccus sp. TOH]WJS83849.1 hypothetical protein NBE95_08730 [Paracoccus sp. TOH]
MNVSSIAAGNPTNQNPRRELSDGLEQAFLSEMLKYAGPRESQGEFGGGIGESQFSSLMNDAYAEIMSRTMDMSFLSGTGVKND